MKRTTNLVRGLIVSGVVLAMACASITVNAQASKEGVAKVIRIKGSARWFMDGNTKDTHPLKVGDLLKPGSTIQTSRDPGAFVDVILGADGNTPMPAPVAASATAQTMAYQPSAEQNIVRVKEDSILGIDKLTSMETGADVVTDTQLDLQRGKIFGNVKKMSAASKYEVKIPNGVAGIRGTTYEISADGLVRVTVGSVVMAYVGPDGTVVTQVVMGGQQFDARTGQITPIPNDLMKDMDASGRDSRIFMGNESRPTEFTEDHTIYRVSPTHGHHPHPPHPPHPGEG